MSIKNTVIKNFFSDEEIELLQNSIEINRKLEHGSSKMAPMIIEQMSRMQIEFLMPKIIEEKLLILAKSFINDNDLILTHHQYLDYFGKYSQNHLPKLPPHIDVENYYSKISMSYQIKSNINWPIIVENEKFLLNDNYILVFDASNLIHWREPIILKENDRNESFICSFSNKNDHDPYLKSNMSKIEKDQIVKKYSENTKLQQYQSDFFDKMNILEKENN